MNKPCNFFQNDTCNKGQNCNFEHVKVNLDNSGLTQPYTNSAYPNQAYNPSQPNYNKPNTSYQGAYPNNAQPKFTQQPATPNKLCQFFSKGSCNRGDTCSKITRHLFTRIRLVICPKDRRSVRSKQNNRSSGGRFSFKQV